MQKSATKTQTIVLAGVSALALAMSPVAFDLLSQDGGLSTAAAQTKGGQGKGGQSGQPGAGKGGKGSGSQSGSSSTQDSLRGSKPSTTGGKPASAGSGGSGGSSSAKLGRLSMAKSFLSPGFDITKIDDPEAPIAQVYAYSLVIAAPFPADDPATAENESEVAINAAGTALGTAATVAPVTLSTIKALNTAGGFTTTWTDPQLTQVATVATAVLEARRDEEGEGEEGDR